MGRVLSVQVGGSKHYIRTVGDREVVWQSGFDKQQVPDGTIEVTPTGVIGDEQVDTKHHGGLDKAVLLYASAHYAEWRGRYPHLSWKTGAFGENLTVGGIDEANVCIGDVYQIGDVVLEISQPRVPCWKISERWREPTLTEAVLSTGKTGWYARVKVPGHISAGDEITRVERPYESLTIKRLNDGLFKRNPFDDDLMIQLHACDRLALAWKGNLLD